MHTNSLRDLNSRDGRKLLDFFGSVSEEPETRVDSSGISKAGLAAGRADPVAPREKPASAALLSSSAKSGIVNAALLRGRAAAAT